MSPCLPVSLSHCLFVVQVLRCRRRRRHCCCCWWRFCLVPRWLLWPLSLSLPPSLALTSCAIMSWCTPCPAHFQLVLGVRALLCSVSFSYCLIYFVGFYCGHRCRRFCLRVFVCVCVCVHVACLCVRIRHIVLCCLPPAFVSSLSFLPLPLPLTHSRCTQHRIIIEFPPPPPTPPLDASTLLALNSLIFEAFVMNLFSCLILVIYLLLALFLPISKPFHASHPHSALTHTHTLGKCGSGVRSFVPFHLKSKNCTFVMPFCRLFPFFLSRSLALFLL